MGERNMLNDLDFVIVFARMLREDNSLFEVHKRVVESHLDLLNYTFKNRFGSGESFKKKAREYLRKRGLL